VRLATSADPGLLADPSVFAAGVPHEELARRRREAPVAWVEERPLRRTGAGVAVDVGGTGYWAVTRYWTVSNVGRDPATFSSAERGAFVPDPKSYQDLERTRRLLINMDEPQHKRIRGVVADAFSPRVVALLADGLRAHAASIVASALERDELDAVRDLAAELPLRALADLFGMPRDDRRLLFEWSNNVVGFDDPDYAAGDVEVYKRTFLDVFAYALELARAKREHPGDDLVSGLVEAGIGAEASLSEEEYCHLWLLLAVAGNETTRHLLSGSLLALVEWPDERDRLIARPDLTRSAVEELLRWVTPTMQFRRTALRDTELDGQEIRAGEKVVLYYASANRDETVFPEPDRLDLARHPNPHLAFGIGPHFCLGAHLARLEAAIMLDALRPHLASFELTGPVVRLQSTFMNGIKSMPARFARA